MCLQQRWGRFLSTRFAQRAIPIWNWLAIRPPLSKAICAWKLGGWISKGCAACLVISPLMTWLVLAPLVAAGYLPFRVLGGMWVIGHINSMMLLPFLLFWYNGGREALIGSLLIWRLTNSPQQTRTVFEPPSIPDPFPAF